MEGHPETTAEFDHTQQLTGASASRLFLPYQVIRKLNISFPMETPRFCLFFHLFRLRIFDFFFPRRGQVFVE
jgi:hypothetical protein